MHSHCSSLDIASMIEGGGARGVGVGGGVQLLVPVGGWCCDDNDGGYSPTAADFCYVGQGGVLIT